MSIRLGAAFVAVASTATILTTGVGTASAAPSPCGTYPPGQAYTISRAPFSGTVRTGTTITTRGTMRRGGQSCVGYPMGFYTKPANRADYRLTGVNKTTDSTGSVRQPLTVTITKRFFYNVNFGGGTSTHSGISEIIAG